MLFEGRLCEFSTNKNHQISRSEKVDLKCMNAELKKKNNTHIQRAEEKQRQISFAQMKRNPDKILLLFSFHPDTQPTALDFTNHFQITDEKKNTNERQLKKK